MLLGGSEVKTIEYHIMRLSCDNNYSSPDEGAALLITLVDDEADVELLLIINGLNPDVGPDTV